MSQDVGVQGAYADPREVESFFQEHCRRWLALLPAGIRSGLPSVEKLHWAVEGFSLQAGVRREAEREAGRRVRERLGLPLEGSKPGGEFSLSHATGFCVAVRWNGACVGVDLERFDRMVSDAVRLRVAAETVLPPLASDLSSVEIWCLKEAAFKSCPWNDGTTLAEYWLESWNADQRIARIGFPPDPEGTRTGSAWATVAGSLGIEAAFAVGVIGVRS